MKERPPRSQRTLDQLAPPSAPAPAWPPLPRSVRLARQVPLAQLTALQLLTLLHHGQEVALILPYALDRVEEDPWATVEFHPGDLLLAVFRTGPRQWPDGAKGKARLRTLARQARHLAGSLPAEQRDAGVEDELGEWLARYR